MNKYVADTMAIVLYLEKRKLPNNIKRIFNHAEQQQSVIYISVVSLMEIGYLSEKSRISVSIAAVIDLTFSNKNFIIFHLDAMTIAEAFTFKLILNCTTG